MKNIKIALSLLAVISLSGCDDFLSETPDNRTQIDTADKISELLVNAYPVAGTYMEFAETMTDNVSDGQLPETLPKNEQNYNWEMNNETNVDTQALYWEACYRAIAHANKALQAINEQGNPSSLNPQKGEALMARAYAHFMLVSFWSQRYNPATADKALGIPYVTEPEEVLIKKYTRNTVKEVFDFIQKDIEEGIKLVENNYAEPKFHFTKEAANAFASRFYLVKGDWDKVLEVSEGIGSKPSTKIRNYAAFTTLDPNVQFVDYAKAGEQANLLIISAYSIYARATSRNRFYFASNKSQEIFGTATNIYGKSWLYKTYSYNNLTSFQPKFKEYFKYTNLTANIGEPYLGTVALSYDEFYLNRIEALVMKNRIAEANTELEYYIGTRTTGYNAATDKLTEAKVVAKFPVIPNEYTPFYEMTPVQTSYVKAIADTKRREFLHEGIRYFDVKRFNIVVTHETFNKPTNILEKDDKRRAIQIPLSASTNGVEKNPR